MDIKKINEIALRSGPVAALATAKASMEDNLIRHAHWLVRTAAEAARKTGKTARNLANGSTVRQKANRDRRASENRTHASAH